MSEQAYLNAHLRPLPRCSVCDKPATEQLYNGVNAPMSVFCSRHAQTALGDFREKGRTR